MAKKKCSVDHNNCGWAVFGQIVFTILCAVATACVVIAVVGGIEYATEDHSPQVRDHYVYQNCLTDKAGTVTCERSEQ